MAIVGSCLANILKRLFDLVSVCTYIYVYADEWRFWFDIDLIADCLFPQRAQRMKRRRSVERLNSICIFVQFMSGFLCVFVGKKEEQIRRRHNELAKRKNTSIYGFSHLVFFLQTLEVVVGGWIGCIGGLGGWGASVVERAQQAEPEGMVRAWARRVVG